MNIEKALETIKLSYKIKRPLLMLSSPGIGKSSSVYQAASQMSEEYGETFSVIEVRAATSNAAELADIKAVIDGKVVDLAQYWVPTKEKVAAGLCAKRGLVFLDEISDGTTTVQSALQQLLLDRRLGSARLADGWGTVAASNRQSDKSAAGRLSTALINRCMTVTVEPDTDSFVKWGLKYGIHPDVIAFCRWKRTPWNFDPTSKNANPAFCSPRSMHILSDILHEIPDPDFELITGTVGDGVGSEMSGFLKLKAELPNLDEIIRDPHGAKVPKRMDIAVAVLYALIGRITDKTVGNILTFLARNPIEIAMAAFMDVCTQKPELVHNKVVQEWMCDKRNTEIISMGY
jgi:hypothetical protein